MNLYRSFGNLMEAWLTEEDPGPDPEWLGNNAKDSPTPDSDMGTNLRSESVDSGVETGSCDTPATSISTDNVEIDLFMPQRGLTPHSTSQSPVLSSPVPSCSSSSSPCLSPSRAEEGSAALHLKLERALQRTESKPLTVDEVLSRRPRASFLAKRHTSELVRSQRSGSLSVRRTVNPSVPVRQMSDLCRRPQLTSCDKRRSEGLGTEKRKELSPGLNYLEQVCQMLEEVARQQMHNRALQVETDALREQQDEQDHDACLSDSTAPEEDLASCQRLENTENAEPTSGEPQQRKDLYRHYRQRSASDTNIAVLHLRKLNADCRGQHVSTNVLLEAEEDHKMQEPIKVETNKTNWSWRLKIGPLRREESSVSDTKSQQMQPSERRSARRRLSQLFKRGKKTPAA